MVYVAVSGWFVVVVRTLLRSGGCYVSLGLGWFCVVMFMCCLIDCMVRMW